MCFSYSERRNEIQQLDVDYCKSVKESKDVEELLLTDLVKKKLIIVVVVPKVVGFNEGIISCN